MDTMYDHEQWKADLVRRFRVLAEPHHEYAPNGVVILYARRAGHPRRYRPRPLTSVRVHHSHLPTYTTTTKRGRRK